MLDRLKPWARHFVLMLASSLGTAFVAWLALNQQTILASVPPYLVPFAVSGLASVALFITKWTKQYGNGSTDPTVDPTPAVAPVVDPAPSDPPASA